MGLSNNNQPANFVYIVILNWNGWRDTIECLESIFRLECNQFCVVVCDNNSSDGSLEKIKNWADGNLNVFVRSSHLLHHLSFPPIPKAISYRQYDRQRAESGGSQDDNDCSLVLIQTGANLGFAGGNNVGIRYALARDDFSHIWILNNDAVVDRFALTCLIDKSKYYVQHGEHRVGIVGSKIFFYDQPTVIQTVGGKYNKFSGATTHIGLLETDRGQYNNDRFIKKADCVIGASMFVSKKFLLDIGLMCEDYFLYYEEMDWVLRGKKHDFTLGYTWQSHVYHKEGGTIGSSSIPHKKSELSDYYGVKNKIAFTRKFFPLYLSFVYLSLFVTSFNRIRRGQFSRLKLIWNVLFADPQETQKDLFIMLKAHKDENGH